MIRLEAGGDEGNREENEGDNEGVQQENEVTYDDMVMRGEGDQFDQSDGDEGGGGHGEEVWGGDEVRDDGKVM
jgi:hypothetical protein